MCVFIGLSWFVVVVIVVVGFVVFDLFYFGVAYVVCVLR